MITFRKATAQDIPDIRHIAEIAFPATYCDIISPEQLKYMMEWMYSEDSLHDQINKQGHVFLLAEINGNPCGYASIEQQGADLFHLQKIYILPEFHGRGIGRSLFEHVTDYIRKPHPTPCLMELNVNRHNRAVSFYEHLGMRRLRSGDFPIGGGYFMNDYIMGMEL